MKIHQMTLDEYVLKNKQVKKSSDFTLYEDGLPLPWEVDEYLALLKKEKEANL
jgi:hypothetical protein